MASEFAPHALRGVFAPSPPKHTWFSQRRSLCSVCSCFRRLEGFSYIIFILFFVDFALECLDIFYLNHIHFSYVFISFFLSFFYWNILLNCNTPVTIHYNNTLFSISREHGRETAVGFMCGSTFAVCFFLNRNKIWFNLNHLTVYSFECQLV